MAEEQQERPEEIFDRLEGTWQNYLDGGWQGLFGWNFISQPQLISASGKGFEMRTDQMCETTVFTKLPDTARNVGTTGQAGFWRAMKYEVSIETPDGEGIHHEVGHFLLKVLEDGTTSEPQRGDIIRQGTIPRANAMMTNGVLRRGSISDPDPSGNTDFYNAKPSTRDSDFIDRIDGKFADKNEEILKKGGPDMKEPLTWLRKRLPDGTVGDDWVFEFRNDNDPSQMANGQRVKNPVRIGNLLSDFWIGSREHEGSRILVLQYAQRVDLKFHGIEWPHVAVNTLIKQ